MATVQDVLSKKGRSVACVKEQDSVLAAAKIMSQQRIGSVVVLAGDQVAGIFTERDVMNRLVAQQLDPGTTIVKDVMTSPVAVCRSDTKLVECKAIMSAKKLRHLPVVEDGKLIGLVSMGDIIAREVVDQEHTIQYMQDYLHGRA